MRSLNSSFIITWNVAGEFMRPKEHDEWFKHATVGLKAAFHSSPDGCERCYTPIECPNLVKIRASFEFVYDIGDERKGVLVLDHE